MSDFRKLNFEFSREMGTNYSYRAAHVHIMTWDIALVWNMWMNYNSSWNRFFFLFTPHLSSV